MSTEVVVLAGLVLVAFLLLILIRLMLGRTKSSSPAPPIQEVPVPMTNTQHSILGWC